MGLFVQYCPDHPPGQHQLLMAGLVRGRPARVGQGISTLIFISLSRVSRPHGLKGRNGLSGERVRWSEDKARFGDLKRQLVGDCCIASAFLSYCGPFNQEYRKNLTEFKFVKAAKACGVPVSAWSCCRATSGGVWQNEGRLVH